MNRTRLLLAGFVIWLAGAVTVRLAGQYLLQTGRPLVTLALYAAFRFGLLIPVPDGLLEPWLPW